MNLFNELGQKIYDWTHSNEQYEWVETLPEKSSSWNDIWSASTGIAKQATGVSQPVSVDQLQAISSGVAEGTVKSIDNIKDISKYLAVAGVIVVGLIIYSKLK